MKHKHTAQTLIKLGLCFSLSLLLLLTGCGADEGDSVAAAALGEGAGAALDAGSPYPGSGEQLIVSFIDVGQGDSTFIELPDGKTMLIDAGESEYGQTVIDYIESRNVDKIDYLVATHPHSDHIGGLPAVVARFDIGSVYMPKAQNNTRIFEKLLTAIKDKGLKVTAARAGGSILSEENLSADIVAPNSDSYSDVNNFSAVIRLTYGDTSFLLMGDAEKKSEDEITEDIDVDVLKVGHHGSAYSTSQPFLQKVTPKYALISCGEGNKYGHPESVILNRLAGANVEVHRTDLEGTVVFTSDGSKITVDKKASPVNENAPPADGINTSTASQSEGGTGAASIAGSPVSGGADSGAQAGDENGSQTATDHGSQSDGSGTSSGTAQTPPPVSQPETPPASQPAAPAPGPEKETIVYITKTGSKYHRDGCQYLRQSQIPVSLEEAKAGYEPCSKCSPPQ